MIHSNLPDWVPMEIEVPEYGTVNIYDTFSQATMITHVYNEKNNRYGIGLKELDGYYIFDKDPRIMISIRGYSKKIKFMKINYRENQIHAKPTITLVNIGTVSMEDIIIGTYIFDRLKISVNTLKLAYRLGIKKISDKNMTIDNTDKLRSGWHVIYLDGNIKNFSVANMKFVPVDEYCKWHKSINSKQQHLTKQNKSDIYSYIRFKRKTPDADHVVNIISKELYLTPVTLYRIINEFEK